MARIKYEDREKIRSERVSLVLTPATYDGIAALAHLSGGSINDVINCVLEQLVKKNYPAISRYKDAINAARADVNLSVDDLGGSDYATN